MNVEQLLKAKGAEATIIGPEKTIGATARLLAERNKGLALVCDADDKLLGVVSVIDISRAVGEFAERAPAMAVETIMTTDFAFCRLEDSVEEVLQKMTERSIRHLPVVEDGVLKGLLNMRGVLESRFEEAEIRADEMRKYVFGIGYH
jgi:CBS domain-containing protein